MDTDTFVDLSLIEDELLGEPCHAVCSLDRSETLHGICGVALLGIGATYEDMLCSTCVTIGATGVCKVCGTRCIGVLTAKWTSPL